MSMENEPELSCTKQEWLTAQKLISAVVRAFYNDTTVVVVDALLRDNAIPDEEIGPRLKLPGKEVRKVLNQLHDEDCLIAKESVPMPKGGAITYYYIDYQHCVDVIRLRVHLMRQTLARQEKESHGMERRQCPSCQQVFTTLQALPMRCRDGYFACSRCCPADDFANILSEPHFRLRAMDTSASIGNVEGLQRKLSQQLSRQLPYREGIFELLHELKDVILPRNLPSQSIKKGLVAVGRLDERAQKSVDYNYLKSAQQRGTGSRVTKKHLKGMHTGSDLWTEGAGGEGGDGEIFVDIYEDDLEAQQAQQAMSQAHVDHTTTEEAHDEANLPDFLRSSRVTGVQEILEKVENIQAERLGVQATDEKEEPAAKRIKVEDEPEIVIPEPEDDNIEWEDDENMQWEAEE